MVDRQIHHLNTDSSAIICIGVTHTRLSLSMRRHSGSGRTMWLEWRNNPTHNYAVVEAIMHRTSAHVNSMCSTEREKLSSLVIAHYKLSALVTSNGSPVRLSFAFQRTDDDSTTSERGQVCQHKL
jgi:hypothetical protein